MTGDSILLYAAPSDWDEQLLQPVQTYQAEGNRVVAQVPGPVPAAHRMVVYANAGMRFVLDSGKDQPVEVDLEKKQVTLTIRGKLHLLQLPGNQFTVVFNFSASNGRLQFRQGVISIDQEGRVVFGDAEPQWIETLPKVFRGVIRINTHEECYAARAIVPRLAAHEGKNKVRVQAVLASESVTGPVFVVEWRRGIKAKGQDFLLPFPYSALHPAELPLQDDRPSITRIDSATVIQRSVLAVSDPPGNAYRNIGRSLVAIRIPLSAVAQNWRNEVIWPLGLSTMGGGMAGDLSLVPELPATRHWRWSIGLLGEHMNQPDQLHFAVVPGSARTSVPVEITLPRLIGTDGRPIVLMGEVGPETEADADTTVGGAVFVRIKLQGHAKPQEVRFGALHLRLGAAPGILSAPLELRVWSRPHMICEAVTVGSRSAFFPYLSASVSLPLTDIVPAGQDPVPGIRTHVGDAPSDEPVVIPIDRVELSADWQASPSRFLASVTEHFGGQGRHTIDLALAMIEDSRSGAPKPQRVVVIDPSPFGVAMVLAPDWKAAATSQGIPEIGNWTSAGIEGSNWELIGSTDGFQLFIPPQVVGEAMEKLRGADGYEDLAEGGYAEFRFGPPTRFRLLPSFFRQRYAEAPWNLRRILGYLGQRAPGAAIQEFTFELHYGMTGHVSTPNLRLAEIASRLGSLIPSPVRPELMWRSYTDYEDLNNAFHEYIKDWEGSLATIGSRLSVLEPYDSTVDGPLRLTDGVSFYLRDSARLRHPIPPSRFQDDPEKEERPSRRTRGLFRHWGLPGGWSYPFESLNILEGVLRDPASTAALLFDPKFSTLGGWGSQQAAYDRGRSSIYTETSMGSVTYVALERIGRIGALWNHAKHVIVYETTTVASEQFGDEQDPHRGRPIPRKVGEYVEILQPRRPLPEGNGPKMTRGCLMASEFESIVIPVDGSWGRDLGKDGWIIPLHNPDANPRLYPMPQVTLRLAGDPKTGNAEPAHLVLEPEKLRFYTSTSPDLDSNTDAWPPVRDVDFLDLPQMAPPEVETHHPGNPDAQLANADELEAGHDALTLRVRSLSGPVNLVAERSDTPILATVHNLTIARGRALPVAEIRATPGPQSAALEVLLNAMKVRDLAGSLVSSIGAAVPAAGIPSTQDRAGLVDRMERLSKQLGGIFEGFTDPVVGFPSANDLAKSVLQEAQAGVVRSADRLADLAKETMSGFAADLKRMGSGVIENSEKLIDQRFRPLEIAARQILTGLEQGAITMRRALQTRVDAADSVVRELESSVRKLPEVTEATLERDLERYRAGLRAGWDGLERILRRVESILQEMAFDPFGELFTPLESWVDAVRAEVDEVFDAALRRPITVDVAAIEVAKAEFAADVEDLLAYVLPHLHSHLEQAFVELAALLEEQLGHARDEIRKFETTIRAAIDALIAKGGSLAEDIIRHLESQEIIAAFQDDIRGLAESVNKALDEVPLADLMPDADQWASDLKAGLRKADDPVLRVLGSLRDLIEDPESSAEVIRREADRIRSALLSDAANFTRPAIEAARAVLGGGAVFCRPDFDIRLPRVFADSPVVQQLRFNRDRIAFYFDEARNLVETTPVMALANRVGQELKSQGLRLPVRGILDRFVPASLERFDLSTIFAECAGIKLEGLFRSVRMPAQANDSIRMTHEVDEQRMRGWLQVDANVPFGEPLTVFSLGPLMLRIERARFTSSLRIEGGLGKPPTRSAKGAIRGDWQLVLSNQALVTFVDTVIRFEDGRMTFELRPQNVRMSGVLGFLSDLLSSTSSGGGFSVQIVHSKGLPTGLHSVLDLALPNLQAGAFGIANLRLLATFGLRVELSPFDFSLAISVGLASRAAPFNLSILFLVGGGWFNAEVLYRPLRGELVSTVEIGIAVGAQLAIALGPIGGSVGVFFGISARFTSTPAGPSAFSLTASLVLRGEVQVLGFVSVQLVVSLEIEYRSGGQLIGRGRITLKVKICWCFTLSFSAGYECTFAGGDRPEALPSTDASALNTGSPPYPDPYELAAKRYVALSY